MKNKERYIDEFKLIIELILKHTGLVITGIFLSVLSVTFMLLQTYFTKKLIENDWSAITVFSFFILIVMYSISIGLLKLVSSKLGAYSGRDLKMLLTEKIMRTEYKDIQKLASGDAVAILNNDCKQIESFLSEDLLTLPTTFLISIGAFMYLLILNPVIGLITFMYTPIGMFLASNINKKLHILYPLDSKYIGESVAKLEQSLSIINIIKSFNMYPKITNDFRDIFRKNLETGMKINLWNSLMQPACLSIANTPSLIFCLVGGLSGLKGNMTLGTFVAMLQLIGYIVPPTVMLPFLIMGLNRSRTSINRINKIMNIKEKEYQPLSERKSNSVLIENLSFSYDSNNLILNDISFSIDTPGITAIVGESGCGKSTIISLLTGLQRPDSGSITISGRNIADMNDYDIASLVSVMPQDIHIFYDDIFDNLRIGNSSASNKNIIKIAKKTGLHNVANSLVDGYDTKLGDGGISLSGGETQKLAFTRMMLKDTDVFILDEPTSALDIVSEKVIHDLLHEIAKDKIVIIVAHRISTIKCAESIIHLKEGRIQSKGTWNDLKDEIIKDCEVSYV